MIPKFTSTEKLYGRIIEMQYFWEIRYFKGKWKIRLLISAKKKAMFRVLEDIPQEGNHRFMKAGEDIHSIIRLCHKKRK